MDWKRPVTLVVLVTLAALAAGTAPTPLWDEDEARFAAIAGAMVESGDWIVPRFNDSLAVDKPVLMHWCMAACMSVFGTTAFAARLPSVIATLLTGLALLRAGRRWFGDTTGVVAALAHAGCLLVAIEAHAATPDAILTALTAWATVLAAEALAPAADGRLVRLGIGRAFGIGLLLGLAVVCKGPVGFVAPLAVVGPWAWCLAVSRRMSGGPATLGRIARATLPAVGDVLGSLRPLTLVAGALAAAAPWYLAVTLRTDGAWTSGFFFVHNVGRFLAPMEKHSGGVLFHPLTMLVGFFPWSCFLPFAVVVAAWRTWRHEGDDAARQGTLLALVWLGVWVGAFSAAATKLPNYVLPAYPAAALVVASIAVEFTRRAMTTDAWPNPRWLATGIACLAFGGVATTATIVLASRYGLPGAEPAAVVGLVPIVGAIACCMLARRPAAALTAFGVTGLVYAALMVGPAQARIATANTLPGFVARLRSSAPAGRPIGTYQLPSPNVVFYAGGHVTQIHDGDLAGVAAFLASDPEAVVLVPEPQVAALRGVLPAGCDELARTRPVFRGEDVVAVGRIRPGTTRTAAASEVTR